MFFNFGDFGGMPGGMPQSNRNVDTESLYKELGVSKDVINDELLNTFGELGQENKWSDPWIGGSYGLESAYEKLSTAAGKGKGTSVGPGQIRFNNIDPELRDKFGITSAKDLYDWDKIIPLMTAINIKNRKWMENKGSDLSKFLIGQPGASAEDLKYGVGRWTPYMYRGSMQDPIEAVKKQARAEINQYANTSTPEEQEALFNNFLNSDEYKRRVREIKENNF